MTEVKDLKETWLVNIFEPFDKIVGNENFPHTSLVPELTKMVTDSLAIFINKFPTDELTDQKREELTDMYVNLLSESTAILLQHYAKDSTPSPYMLPKNSFFTLRKYFMNVVSDKSSSTVLLKELFINNFVIYHFNAVINSIQHREKVKNEIAKN